MHSDMGIIEQKVATKIVLLLLSVYRWGNRLITVRHLPECVPEHTQRKQNLNILLHATILVCLQSTKRIENSTLSWVWWHMAVMSALRG